MDNLEVASMAENPETIAQAIPQEKMLAQSEVNEIVGRAKREAAQRAVEEYRRSNTESSAPSSHQGQASYNENDFRKLAAEEAQRLRDQWVDEAKSKAEEDYAQRIVKNFWDKVDTAKGKYEDFDAVTGDMALDKFPNVVHLLSDHIENSGDVLYELGKDRFKLAQLEQLAQYSPRDAISQAKRLAQSISDNQAALNTRSAKEPLSHMRSTHAGADTGVLSVSDYRKKYKV